MNGINTVSNDKATLKQLKEWAKSFGFQSLGVSDIDLSKAEKSLEKWLKDKFHGEMDYMERHGYKRSRPDKLVEGTVSVITVRMDYWPDGAADAWDVIADDQKGFISRYALGRDYHKLMRKRLSQLVKKIQSELAGNSYRVFCDSAPVLEKALAEKSGLGWLGKHSNILSRENGSYFFLGEIYTDLPLSVTEPVGNHCGRCTACIDVCPTQAIVAPYVVDARRCISYLTIELRGTIPEMFRPMIGNRIYGCDDCQLVCPWNKFAQVTVENDYLPRHGLDNAQLVDLFSWNEVTFLSKMEGSPIRRIGYECWLRNIAVALGNTKTNDQVISALRLRQNYPSALVREHVEWALSQHLIKE